MRRVDGREKVTGQALYTADVQVDRRAYGKLVLSPYAHARIGAVDKSAAVETPGVLGVFTGADLPEGIAGAGDKIVARDYALYAGQPVAVVVGESEAAAADGAANLFIDYEPRQPVTSIAAATAAEAPLVIQQVETTDEAATHGAAFGGGDASGKPRNATSSSEFKKGDVDAAFAACAAVVERRFEIAAVHQGFLEPHVSLARSEDGMVTVWTSSQSRFDARDAIADQLGIEHGQVVVNPMTIGGGFGGKWALLDPLAAFCAREVGRPVLIPLTRTEEFLLGRGAPGCVIEVKAGVDGEGVLQALRARVQYDSGAAAGYHGGISSYFLVVPYRIANYDVTGYDIATHKTPGTAYRAPGATQAFFAMECVIEELAHKLGMDPIELRLRNAVRDGDTNPAGQEWTRIGLVECLEAARQHPVYTAPVGEGEGVGVAIGGWGGANSPATAVCRVDPDGTLVLQLGTVDISGTDTTFAMLAADALGVSPERIRIEKPDSSSAPHAPGSGGSVTTYSVGPAVLTAATELRNRLRDLAADVLEAAPDDLELTGDRFEVRGVPGRGVPLTELVAAAAERGQSERLTATGEAAVAHAAPVFTVQIARARVDRETGQFETTGFAAIQDVGKALNPPEVVGQIHGGLMQALGRALGEELVWDGEGQLRTATFADYRMPTIDQTPEIDVRMLEIPSELGPLGAKHVGEPPAIPAAAALANAVSAAAGVRVTTLPIDPESLITR